MKKYKVTDKHPVYREGLIYEEDEDGDFNLLHDEKDPSTVWETIGKTMIEGHMSEGWLEEVQQPEFTKRDLTGFADFCLSTRIKDIDSAYETWIDIKK